TPPEVNPFSPPNGNNGWYKTPVFGFMQDPPEPFDLHLPFVHDLVIRCPFYYTAGDDSGWTLIPVPFDFAQSGTYDLSAVDLAGNVSPNPPSHSVSLDLEKPTFEWHPNGDNASWGTTDAKSGIASWTAHTVNAEADGD